MVVTFSLTRFLAEDKKQFPCWLAGRFYFEEMVLNASKINPSEWEEKCLEVEKQTHVEIKKNNNRQMDLSLGQGKNKTQQTFQIQSQGLKISCEGLIDIQIQQGDFIVVQVISFKNQVATIQDCKQLSSSQKISKINDDITARADKAQTTNASLDASTATATTVEITKNWVCFLKYIRDYLNQKNLTEVETPSLVHCPGTEPHLQVFKTEMNINSKNKKLYLVTSPEMHLKKLLCQGWTDFFEIKKCFRNGEMSSSHEPEFYMLEWYRAFFSLEELIDDSLKFLSHLADCFADKPPLNFSSCNPSLNNPSSSHSALVGSSSGNFRSEASSRTIQIYSVQDLFKKFLGFALQPQSTQKQFLLLAQEQHIPCSQSDSFEDLFHLIFLNCIEPKFKPNQITVVKNYPPSLRAFARINKENWASRFEIYWGGFEIANAFYEVIDAKEQKKIFEQHLQQRQDLVPLDEELLSAMESGMPYCSGIAIGLDRLFLALTQQKSISDIKLFPFNK